MGHDAEHMGELPPEVVGSVHGGNDVGEVIGDPRQVWDMGYGIRDIGSQIIILTAKVGDMTKRDGQVRREGQGESGRRQSIQKDNAAKVRGYLRDDISRPGEVKVNCGVMLVREQATVKRAWRRERNK